MAFFGGTFDPIHNGHVNTVNNLLKMCSLEHVFIVPTSVSPHKSEPRADPAQRLKMVQLAIADKACMSVDDREVFGRAPAYTFDTVQSFRTQYPNEEFALILGVDAFLGFERWHRWAELLDMASFLIMRRPGWKIPEKLPDWWKSRKMEFSRSYNQPQTGEIMLVDVEPHGVSSTEIRLAVSQGVNASELVEKSVWEYICEENLYKR